MSDKVYICITTRDGKPDYHVTQAIQRACTHFNGETVIGIAENAYNVCVSRNIGVSAALVNGFTHLMFVDNDIILPPDAISKLYELNAPVATGCVPCIGTHTHYPMILVAFDRNTDTESWAHDHLTWHRTWFDGALPALACGAGCLMIKREVLLGIEFPWFRWPEYVTNGFEYAGYESEDVDFCKRIHEAGFDLTAHGDVRCGHRKHVDAQQLIPEPEGVLV